jgi:hypothetical protein
MIPRSPFAASGVAAAAAGVAIALASGTPRVGAQASPDRPAVAAHAAAAKAAAGTEWKGLFSRLCAAPPAAAAAPSQGSGAGPAPPPAAGPPDRATWYAPPVKVFDNL